MRLVAIAIFGLLVRSLSAQVAGGAVTGTVTDPSGNAIANAQVRIEEKSRNEVRQITTNQNGLYNAPNLNPGNYDIRVSAPGLPH